MRLKAKRGTIIAAVAVAAFVVYVVSQNRGVAPYNWPNIATWLVVGISLGGIYAISALGLVVTYSTTGIFNFAQGAIGCFLAFVYWELRVNRHWPAPLALVVVVFVMAPLLGVALDKLLMRRLRNVALVVQLMVTVGLMLAFMGLTLTIWKPDTGRSLNHFFESSSGVHIGQVVATWSRIITVVVALVIAFSLRAVLYRTRLGIAMRAVVDNRPLAGLNGARPGVVSGAAWALGCMTAAIAGILIAPETGMVVENLTLIIIIALAAAVIGQMKSLPWAFVGGMIVGLIKAFSSQFLAYSKDYSYANDAIPAIILLVAVLFLPQARLETGRPHLTRRTERLTKPWEAALGALVMVGVVTAWANGWIPWFSGTHFGQRTPVWLGRGAGFMVTGLIMLSLVPLIGWAGQVSFANFAIAGFGAAMYAHVGGQHGRAIGLIWVVLICAPLGVAIAVPVLRLKGLYVALATMAFAELADRHPVPPPGGDQPGQTGQLLPAPAPLRLPDQQRCRLTARRSSSSWPSSSRLLVLPAGDAPALEVRPALDRHGRQPGGVGHRRHEPHDLQGARLRPLGRHRRVCRGHARPVDGRPQRRLLPPLRRPSPRAAAGRPGGALPRRRLLRGPRPGPVPGPVRGPRASRATSPRSPSSAPVWPPSPWPTDRRGPSSTPGGTWPASSRGGATPGRRRPSCRPRTGPSTSRRTRSATWA